MTCIEDRREYNPVEKRPPITASIRFRRSGSLAVTADGGYAAPAPNCRNSRG
jgi:hypothetical protein